MLLGDRILVVDDSRFMLEVLGRVLGPHCSKVFSASSYRAALQELEQNPGIGTIICDVILPDGNGFQLLEQLASGPKSMPKLLLITAHWVEDDRQRALSLGAIGYLPKPISLRDIRTALAMPASPRPRDPRHRTLAKAWIVDPERRERLLSLGIHDISATGALLDTTGPLPVGTKLEFEIIYSEDQVVRARGTVVRVQEPSWLDVGGAGIHFEWVESLQRLNELIRRHDLIPAHA
jgi:CheY-like chemotaxis protein